eukprot:Nitzschia sp. Nitz4//scaffold6_size259037//81142//84016//NITZ4_001061-RA/size259037-augustus-gene-0.288-mRNA-1//1//CDS//3329556854//4304//frame0
MVSPPPDKGTTPRTKDDNKDSTSDEASKSSLQKTPSNQRPNKSYQDEDMIRRALQRNSYFTCMDDEQVDRFVKAAELRTFPEGTTIIMEACRDEKNNSPSDDASSALEDGDYWLEMEQGVDVSDGPATVEDVADEYYVYSSSQSATDSGHAETHSNLLYIIRQGKADVYYDSLNPASLGPGSLIGEGGFLFEREHSASVIAGSALECWVVDYSVFMNEVLPSRDQQKQFESVATRKDESGDMYMSVEECIRSCFTEQQKSSTAEGVENSSVANTLRQFLRSSVQNNSGEYRIYLPDYCLFRLFMARPDPEVDIIFLLMDKRRTGAIAREDFEDYLRRNFPFFDPKSEFVDRHFYPNQVIRPYKFSQFLGDLKKEIGKQEFLYRARLPRKGRDKDRLGYLDPHSFVDVLKTSMEKEVSKGVLDRLEALYCSDSSDSKRPAATGSNKVNGLGTSFFAFQDFIAFQDVLSQLRGVCNLIERACKTMGGSISPEDLKVASQILGYCGELSRAQVDIIFQLFDLDRDGFISTEDALSVCGLDSIERLEAVVGREGRATFSPPPTYIGKDKGFALTRSQTNRTRPNTKSPPIMEEVTEFLITTASAMTAVLLVYPLDLVKTRMMNQRAGVGGTLRYNRSIDCLRRTFVGEGFLGLYRGLLPACLACGPEKYIKFAVADLVRSIGTQDEQVAKLHWSTEAVCGGVAGACQLLVTNPLELTKIRMQMQGETTMLFLERRAQPPKAPHFSEIVRVLGASGLYKGAAACLFRDIPFGAIYYPTYSACKEYLAYHGSDTGEVSASNILLAGTIAGVPASFLTTPADVVKTRLQVLPRLGETTYTGLQDCVAKIYKREGITAFFKGSFFRVCRISPQFGISLLTYEKISEMVGYQGFPKPPTNAYISVSDYISAFPRLSSPRNAITRNAQETESLIQKLGLGTKPSS